MGVKTQLNQGKAKRLMYFENKAGDIDGVSARIGWATFSKSGQSIFYRDRRFAKIKGGGISGNFRDVDTREEYWISGVKARGSNAHPAVPLNIVVDDDALDEYRRSRDIRSSDSSSDATTRE